MRNTMELVKVVIVLAIVIFLVAIGIGVGLEAYGQDPPVTFNWENALEKSNPSMGLLPGVGYNPFPGRPDPWAAVEVACGWDMGPSINIASDSATVPSSLLPAWEARVEEQVQRTGLTRERLLFCLDLGQDLYRQRYGAGPPTPGNGIQEPSQSTGHARFCSAERTHRLIGALEYLWAIGGYPKVGGREYTGRVTLRETYDASWRCDRSIVCDQNLAAGAPGSTPENRAPRCSPNQPQEWVEVDAWGCTVYMEQARPGCSEVEPPPDNGNGEEPDPDPECPECPPDETHGLCGPGGPCERLAAEVEIALLTPRWGIGPDGTAVQAEDGRYLGFRRRFLDKFEEWAEACRAQEVYCPKVPSTGRVEIEVVPGGER